MKFEIIEKTNAFKSVADPLESCRPVESNKVQKRFTKKRRAYTTPTNAHFALLFGVLQLFFFTFLKQKKLIATYFLIL
jgi:hypothetical protein